jgi:6-phosphofructokinase 1
MKKRALVLTGGGDCPGLNAVIRAIVKRASQESDWEVWGCRDAFNGLLWDEVDIWPLTNEKVAGIHILGGTIVGTTNKGGPFSWPVQQPDGSWVATDRSDELIRRMEEHNIHAVINIGGDGSQRISQKLYEKGVNIIGVPKTIDNDLYATDNTFGFQTAVQIATESLDKLVTTAESHNRVLIMEVMGRDAGWIALHTAIAGGAEVCLIPEIPYDIDKVVEKIRTRYKQKRGFANIVIAEGAKSLKGEVISRKSAEVGYENALLGGIGYQLANELKDAECPGDIRVTVLGHVQRGGTPIAYDRVLATQFGVKAFEMVLNGSFGQMVAYRQHAITQVSLIEATERYNYVGKDNYLLHTARSVGIAFGD